MKNKKDNKKGKKVYIFIIIIVLIIVSLLFYFLNNENNNNIVFKYIKDMNNIVAKIVNYPVTSIRTKEEIKNLSVVESENKKLKEEIEKYKKELNMKQSITDKKLITGTTIKRSLTYWYDTITIDIGEKDGVKKGDAAMNYEGLIGKVIKTNKNSSDVKLLTSKSKNNYVSATITYKDKVYYGLIDNYNLKTNELHLKNVIGDFSDDIIGINVVTSGLSDSFSSGLLIGKVKRINKDNYGISNDIYISPASDFNDITVISVVGR